MPIAATTPVTVPAQPEAIYNVWWIARLFVQSDDASRPTTASVVYRLGKIEGGGNFVPYLDANGQMMERLLQLNDVFALAATNADVATAMNGLITLLGTLGQTQGVIS